MAYVDNFSLWSIKLCDEWVANYFWQENMLLLIAISTKYMKRTLPRLKTLIVFLAVFSFHNGFGQLTNGCGDGAAGQLTVGASCSLVTFNLSTNTDYWNGASGCNAGDYDDVWGWFDAVSTSTTITYQPANNRDAILHLFTGTCDPNMTALDCSNVGGNGVAETITYATTIGTRYRIRIQRNNSNSDMNGTICVYSPAIITSFSPTAACPNSGQQIVITGAGFTGATAVHFNGVNATTFTVNSATQITATLPAGATTGTITVTTSGGTAASVTDFVANPAPTDVIASASSTSICSGQTVDLTSSATSNSNTTTTTLLTQNFNGGLGGWTITQNSTGGTNGTRNGTAWSQRANGTTLNGQTLYSNDNTQFYASVSSGHSGATNTSLISPVFSTEGISPAATLTLSFYHYFRYSGNGGTESINADISINGGAWVNLQTHTGTTVGLPNNFAYHAISLDSYLNQPNVRIRFNYQASTDFYWAIDNVSITATPVIPEISYMWTSSPAGFTSTEQNPTGVLPTGDTTYTVTATNNYGCSTTATVDVTVTPTQSADIASSTETLCFNTILTDITHTTTGATGIQDDGDDSGVNGLPTGVSATWANDTITISGTPTELGTFNYEIPLTGGCGTATATGTIIVEDYVADAGIITGDDTVCQGQTNVVYTVPSIDNATSYVWDLPLGASITSGENTNSIVVSFANNAASGTISVYGTNSCGDGNATDIYVTVNPLPDNAGTIVGDDTVCQGQTGVIYSVPAVANADNGYIWNMPSGATIVSGNNTNSITVDFANNATSGVITVYGINDCGDGVVSADFDVTVNPLPANTGTISGTDTVCQGETHIYSVSIANATSYEWTISGGANYTETTATNQITIDFSIIVAPITITVYGTNDCGSGVVSTDFNILVTPLPVDAGIITGDATVCQGQTGVTYTIPTIANATGYVWSVPSGATIVSGDNTNSITIDFADNAVSGDITVYGTNCGTGTSSILPVTVNPLPGTGTIAGYDEVCQGETHAYNVSFTNASSYTWTVPTNATIISGQGTNSIVVEFGNNANSGDITVYATNGCGDGVMATLPVTVNTSPYIDNDYTPVICSEGTVTVTPVDGVDGNIVPTGTTYAWGLPVTSGGITGATANSGQSSFSQTLVNTTGATQTAVYTVTASTGGCSNSTFIITVTVNPKPIITASPVSTSICSGENFEITLLNPNNIVENIDFNWTRNVVLGISGMVSGTGNLEGTMTNSTNSPLVVTFTIVATTDSGCDSEPITVNVTVNPMPVVTAPSSICMGNTATLTSTISGGTWTSSDTDIATINNAGVVTPTGLYFGEVTFTYTTAGGCSDSKNITIYDNPAVTAPAMICQGSTATLSPTTGGTWTSSNPAIATVTNAGVITPVTTGNVTFTFINANGCSSTTSTVQISPAPPVINSVTASASPICSGNPSILTVDVQGNLNNTVTLANYQFNNNTNNSANINNVTCSFTTDLATSYTANNGGIATTAQAFTTNGANRGLIQTDNQGNNDAGYWQFELTGTAVQNYQNFRVYFQARRAVTGGINKTITVQYRRNSTGTWQNLPGGTLNLNNNTTNWQTGLFTLPAGVDNPTSLQIRLNVSDGYTGNSSNSSNHPHVTIDNFQIQGTTISNDYTYSWVADTGANGGLPAGAATPSNNNDIITVMPEETTTYTVTVTNAEGCSSTDTVTVNVLPTPEITIVADYCPTDNPATPQNEANMVQLTASSSNATITNWLWSTGETTQSIYVDIADVYQVIGTSTNLCPGSASIGVSQELVINGDFTQGNVGFGSDYTYRADGPGNNELVDDSIGPGNPPAYVNGYSITTNGQNVHNNFWGRDHTQNTTGPQNFMAVNGHGTQYVVWRQTVTVEANTTYYFSAWAMSLNSHGPYANLQFRVDGVLSGSTLQLGPHAQNNNQASDNWQRFWGTWTTATGGDILIEIVNLEDSHGGNDFGIDDISFGTLSTFITLTSAVGTDDTQIVCQDTPITNITYDIGGGLTPPAITGLPAGLTTTYNGLVYTISGTPTEHGTFNYTIETGSDCGEPKTATGTITVQEAPTAIVAPIASVLCHSDGYVTVSATFGGSATGGSWSGGTGTFQNQGTIGNTVTAEYHFGATETGIVNLTFTANAPISSVCTDYSISVPITISNVNPGTISGPAQATFCMPTTATISLTGTAVTPQVGATLTYQWESSTVDCNSGFSPVTTDDIANRNYTVPAGLTQTTYFRRKVTFTINGVSCSAYTNCFVIIANEFTVGTISADQVICRSDVPTTLTFTVPATAAVGATLTYQWQRSTSGCASGWSNITGEVNDTFTPPALTATTYYRVRVTSTLNGRACSDFSNCVTITVNPLVQQGSISGNRSICYGDIPTALTGTTPVAGATYQWQSSTDGLNFDDIVGATSFDYAPGATYQTTYFRRITILEDAVNGLFCSSIPSNMVTVTVNAVEPPVIAANGDTAFCGSVDPDEFIIITPATSASGGNLTYQWQRKTASDCSVDTGWTNISGATGATYNPGSISQTTYYRVRVRVNNVSACDVYSNCIEITAVGRTWNGSVSTDWNNPNNWTPVGVPTNQNCVVVPNVTNNPIIQGTNYIAYALNVTVLAGGNLTINGSNTLIATDFIDVNTNGIFTINNDGSLVQINDVANTGDIVYNRTATDIGGFDYVYWSSPVSGQVLNTIYTTPAQGPRYLWNPTASNVNTSAYPGVTGNWEGAGGATMEIGRGYIVRGSNSTNMPATDIHATFSGVPHNGNVYRTVSRGDFTGYVASSTVNGAEITNEVDNLNLLGNPYPSAINALDFLAVNTYDVINNPSGVLTGSVELWTHGTPLSASTENPFYGSYANNYTIDDYVTINFLGANNPAFLDDFIRSGQAFFVTMIDGPTGSGQVEFNNSMRLDAAGNPYYNGNFFRASSSNLGVGERHRIWIDLIDSDNSATRTLVGYSTNAEDGFDALFDARTSVPNHIKIYSLIDNDIDVYKIQGRNFPFSQDDRIRLGVNITQAGNYTIALNTVDGIFLEPSQVIYLEDKLMNIIHDLKVSPYSFTSDIGSFHNRFEIVYQTQPLGTNNPDLNTIAAFITDETMFVNATKNIKEITLYDMAGKKIKTFTNDIPTNNFQTPFNYPNGIYIAKIKLEDDTIVNAKLGN